MNVDETVNEMNAEKALKDNFEDKIQKIIDNANLPKNFVGGAKITWFEKTSGKPAAQIKIRDYTAYVPFAELDRVNTFNDIFKAKYYKFNDYVDYGRSDR